MVRWLPRKLEGMCLVNAPVLDESRGEFLALDNQQVFCIFFFRCLREVEGPGDNHIVVDDHDRIVRDCIGPINVSLDSRAH